MQFKITLKKEDKNKLIQIAKNLDYTYAERGSISQLCKAIAEGEIILIKK